MAAITQDAYVNPLRAWRRSYAPAALSRTVDAFPFLIIWRSNVTDGSPSLALCLLLVKNRRLMVAPTTKPLPVRSPGYEGKLNRHP